MKPSRFNIVTAGSGDVHQIILFNSLRGSLTLWNPDEFEVAKTFLSEPIGEPKAPAEKAILGQLTELGFVVNDECDEMQLVLERKTAGMKDPNRLDVIVLPNMDCNFRCPYCYELHKPSSQMSDDVERGIVRFLEAQVPRFKVLLLSWFGGEPLLSYQRVLSISAKARDLCARHDVALVSNITTNGYLLNNSRIDELVGLGIHNYQITVDGPPEVHDRTRRLRNGAGTFSKVYENIVALARSEIRVKVSLRVNFNHENIEAIPRLLEVFPADIRGSLRVVYEPIFGDHCLSATRNLAADSISSKLASFYALARRLGYDVVLGDLPVGQLVYCYAERENQFIFGPNGDLFKCSVSHFEASDRFGYLTADGTVVRDEAQWRRWFGIDLFDDKCYSCTVLPLCMGGCRRARIEGGETGSFCKLVPTNASYTLKTLAFGGFEDLLRKRCGLDSEEKEFESAGGALKV
jgi:uncharacterized protein